MRLLARKTLRESLLAAMFFLPEDRKIRLNRWLRGRHEYHKLRHADAAVVSFGKSGRTWLRVMLTRYYQAKHKIDKMELIGFYNFHKHNKDIPRLFFTHDTYIDDYVKTGPTKAHFYDRNVVLLVRDPRDVAVSSYFQRKYRGNESKLALRDISIEDGPSMFEFVAFRVPLIIDFLNAWQAELKNLPQALVVRYEDLKTDPAAELAKILDFLGTPGSDEEVADAVSFADYENMKKLEASGGLGADDRRITPVDRDDPNTYKVRRAKVGGYRDYFTEEEVAAFDDLVATRLAPEFGYAAVSTRPDVDPPR